MLKKISRHIKDLLFVKQILYGFSGLVIVRNIYDIYIHVYSSGYNKYDGNISVISNKSIHDVFNKKITRYYKNCGEKAINSDNIFVSKKIYTILGQKYEGLLYFSPYKDKQNNILGTASYKIEIDYLKIAAAKLFKNSSYINNANYELNYLYHNLIIYKDLFDEIIKIIHRLDTNNIIHDNNIVLIGHLKTHLNILLNNLKQTHSKLSVSL